MRVTNTEIDGLLLVDLQCFRDDRGSFLEFYQEDRYRAAGIHDHFVQDNHSRSMKGVLRGLHFQIIHPQAQIITVIRGRIFDVAVDLRQRSKTFGRWFGAELSEEGPRQLYMPSGFAHGFCVLSEAADLHYKVSGFYDADDEGGIVWNDPEIAVQWPLKAPILSSRDRLYPKLRELNPEQLPRCE